MDFNNPPKYVECDIDNQIDIFEHIGKLRSFIFRGHRKACWDLSSSFEREYNKYPISQMIDGAEQYSINFFKKRAHLYEIGIKKDSNLPDIISSMQHHGCPTRLLDFTESFYIATYFAVNDPNEKGKYSIWALNNPVLKSKAKEMAASYFGSKVDADLQLKELVYKLLAIKPMGVLPVEVETISRRMSSQQGVLLAQTNIRMSFISNLCEMLSIKQNPEALSLDEFKIINTNIINSIYIIKFNFSDQYIQSVRNELLNFNLTSENLFPDLNGLAKSAVEHLFWQY
jgi:hypothetical protein